MQEMLLLTMDASAKINILNFIGFLTKFTVRIDKAAPDGKMTGFCSGFLYQSDPKNPLMVITAGHQMPPKVAFIETRITRGDRTVCLNAGEFNVFYNHVDIDYAYSRLPLDIIRRDLDKEMKFDYTAYRHRFILARKREAYGFAVWNNYEIV